MAASRRRASRAAGRAAPPSGAPAGGMGWPGVVALAAALGLSFFASWRKIWAADFWWQHATGRLVAEGGPVAVDVFSYTVPGAPWIELRWLYCLGQYLVMEQWGPVALLLGKWLAVLAAFALVTLPELRRGNAALAGTVLVVALLAASQRLFVRPELVTYLLFGLFVWRLDAWRRRGGRWIWALPVAQVVWVNSHTLFVFGPLLVGLLLTVECGRALFARGDDRPGRRELLTLAGVLAATVAACLVNPWGVDGLLFPLRLFAEIRGSLFKASIGEFAGPFALGLGYTAVRFYVVLLVLAGLSALANLRRLDPFWTLLCAAQLYLSLLAIRNLPLLCLAAVPFVLSNASRSPLGRRPWLARRLPWARRAAAAAAVALAGWASLALVTDRWNVRQNDSNRFGSGLAPYRYPLAAAEFLQRQGLERPGQRVFASFVESSYLVSRGYRVFIDPRLEVYGEGVFGRYLAAQRDPESLRREVERYDVPLLVAELRAGVAQLAWELPEWRLVWLDAATAVFARRDVAPELAAIDDAADFAAVVARLRRELPPPLPWERAGPFDRVASPAPYFALADFLLRCGQADAAEGFLADTTAAAPFHPGLPELRAKLAQLRGDWPAVAEQARAALAVTPGDAALQVMLGEALFKLGDDAGARTWLERSLAGAPDRALTWAALGTLAARAGALEEAEGRLARAVELDPASAGHRANLGRLQARRGRLAEAAASLAAAADLAPDDPALQRDLALVAAARGDLATARRHAARGLELAPTDPTLRRLASELARRQ